MYPRRSELLFQTPFIILFHLFFNLNLYINDTIVVKVLSVKVAQFQNLNLILGLFFQENGRGHHAAVKGSGVPKRNQKACPLRRIFSQLLSRIRNHVL